MKKISILLCSLFMALPFFLFSQDSCCEETSCSDEYHCPAQADMYGPIGIRGNHLHSKGSLMASYSFMQMDMNQNMSETSFISNQEIYTKEYMLAPEKMQMQMQMLGIMYAPIDRVTIMAMANYSNNSMSLFTMDDEAHNHGTTGLGDVKISALAGLINSNNQNLILKVGVSIPIGDFQKIDQNSSEHPGHAGHHGAGVLPYPMRLGSGTWDFLLGISFRQQFNAFSFGAQFNSIIRTGTNAANYTLGNHFFADTWVGLPATDWLSFSIRINGIQKLGISGSDPDIHRTMAPPGDAANSGFKQLNTGIGVNFLIPGRLLSGLSFGFEYLIPVYQNYIGIQMRNKGSFQGGIKYVLF